MDSYVHTHPPLSVFRERQKSFGRSRRVFSREQPDCYVRVFGELAQYFRRRYLIFSDKHPHILVRVCSKLTESLRRGRRIPRRCFFVHV